MSGLMTRHGKWVMEVSYQGKRHRATTGLADSPANRPRAEQLLAQAVAASRAGHDPRPLMGLKPAVSTLTLRAFVNQWLTQHAPAWRSNTVRTREDSFRYLLASLGDRPVARLTRNELLDFRARLMTAKADGGRGLSPATVNRVLRDVRPLVAELAAQHPALKFDSASTTLLKKVPAPKVEVSPFTNEELQLLLKEVPAGYNSYLALRVETGARVSEINALTWADLNLNLVSGTVSINHILVDGKQQPPKSESSVRTLPLSPTLTAQLRAEKQQSGARELVFVTSRGLPMTDNFFSKYIWPTLLKKCGITYRRPHVLRHSYASHALQRGVPVTQVARDLGHADITTLCRVYAHLVMPTPGTPIDLHWATFPNYTPPHSPTPHAPHALSVE